MSVALVREKRSLNAGCARQRGAATRVVLWVILGLGLMLAAYFAGTKSYFGEFPDDAATASLSEVESGVAADTLASMKNELEVQRKRHELDRRALELVRSEMASENDRIGELEEELRFYRSLMAPKRVPQGVSVRQPELVAKKGDRRFAFRIITQQNARKHLLLKGTLAVEVQGQFAGQEVSYPLSELSADVEDEAVALQFRYFQALEGGINLPIGFEPKAISVLVKVSKPKKLEFREQYPWQLQERFTHVGK